MFQTRMYWLSLLSLCALGAACGDGDGLPEADIPNLFGGTSTSGGAGGADAATVVEAGTDGTTTSTPDGTVSPNVGDGGGAGVDAGSDSSAGDAAEPEAGVEADGSVEGGVESDAGERDASADTAPEECEHCTGPGDWGPGDYPPALREQDYLTIEGVEGQGDAVRGYKVHVPPGYDPNVPAPVVFAFHGLSQNPVMYAIDGANWPEKSDAEGFVLVMPTGNVQNADGSWGLTGSWNAGECCGGSAQSGVDDVALIRAIFAAVGEHVNIDLSRVYATGLSNGGFFSYRLACEASDLFVAIAPGAGAIGTPDIAPMGVGNSSFATCEPTHPVSVLAFHGTADTLVPYGYFAPSLSHIAEENGCEAETQPASQPASAGDTTCITHTGCPGGVEVSGCTVDGGGHCWFGNETCGTGDPTGIGLAIVGANSDTLVSTDAAWAFFERFSRP